MGLTQRIIELVAGDEDLARRLVAVRDFSRSVRAAEYHLTNACNLRCKGCWFFEYDFDRETHELTSPEAWKQFAVEQREAGITAALIIGGEPSLYPERVGAFVSAMQYVTISSNGLTPLPRDGFENVAIAVTLFGGGALDDELRAIKPNGKRFTGLFEEALDNYRNDDRATFIYAITPEALEHTEETVARIRDNGNRLTFNYYSSYGSGDPLHVSIGTQELLEEALRLKDAYPQTVVCDSYFIRTLITGKTEWARFGYDVCPSISVDHPAHAERLRNGNPVLPGFAAYSADAKTLNFCCTSGHCESCRDSQAVFSWLLVSLPRFLGSKEQLTTWVEIAESYWRQFVWSPFHPRSAA